MFSASWSKSEQTNQSWDIPHLLPARVVFHEDTKVPNSATFVFNKEDHTLANMLKGQLLHDPQVRFAGYKVPHPLEPRFELNIQTNDETTPVKALDEACQKLQVILGQMSSQFKAEVEGHQGTGDSYRP